MSSTLTPGQTVTCDITGAGHYVLVTYVKAVPVSKRYPLGGHKVRGMHGDVFAVLQAPVAHEGTLAEMLATDWQGAARAARV